MANIAPYAFIQELDNNGEPLSGGKIYTYDAGTTTPKTTYTDATETTSNANPIILDASGRADIWLGSGSYKFVLTDSDDNTIKTVDNISGSGTGIVSYTLTGATSINEVYNNARLYCDGSFALALSPVGDLNDGFEFRVKNIGSGVITINPDSAETIDDALSITVPAGASILVSCTGTEWFSSSLPDDIITTDKIADNAVTLEKMEDGTQGDILYYGASGAPTMLTAGTSGQVLQTQGAGANPQWADNAAPQVLQATNSTQQTTTSTTFTDITSFSQAITPAASASAVKVTFCINAYQEGADGSNSQIRIMRDIDGGGYTDISGTLNFTSDRTNSSDPRIVTYSFVDTGITTGVVNTYKLQFRTSSGSSTVYAQYNNYTSTLILEEVL